MQQKKDRRAFRSGLSIKDREPIYLDGAIKSRVFHTSFLSLCEPLKRQNHRNGKLQCVRSMHDTALSCHLEDKFQLNRCAEWKARDTINHATWILVFSEDVLQQVRSSIRDLRLIAHISRSSYQHTEPNDARHLVERSEILPRDGKSVETREVRRLTTSVHIELRSDAPNELR